MTLRFPHWNKAGPYPVLVTEDGQNGGSNAGDGCWAEGARWRALKYARRTLFSQLGAREAPSMVL